MDPHEPLLLVYFPILRALAALPAYPRHNVGVGFQAYPFPMGHRDKCWDSSLDTYHLVVHPAQP